MSRKRNTRRRHRCWYHTTRKDDKGDQPSGEDRTHVLCNSPNTIRLNNDDDDDDDDDDANITSSCLKIFKLTAMAHELWILHHGATNSS